MIPLRLLRSFTFRLALLYTALSVGSMVLLLGFIYWTTAGYMDRQVDTTIEEEILGLAERYQSRGLKGLRSTIENRVARVPNDGEVYLLTDAHYRVIVGNLNRWPDIRVDNRGWTHFRLLDWVDESVNSHEARARVFHLPGNLHLLVGRDVRELEQTQSLILEALGWGLAITFTLAIGIGVLMGSRVIRRIDAVNQTSREIMNGELSRRVPTDGSGDDFDQLADNLNQMLDRIGELMAAVRQVSDNIAHDLRTPLTRLHTRLEQARTSDCSVVRQQVDLAINDTEEMLLTFNALLRIARIEFGQNTQSFESLDLARLVLDVAELYEPVAAEKAQNLVVESDISVPVWGDRDLLFQLLANLLDNAIKHTPSESQIVLFVSIECDCAQVRLCDSGPGIPLELHEKIFQRFYRADVSRTTAGSGLGLSLVRAVADLHKAKITLSDNAPGLCVSIALPLLEGDIVTRL